MSTNATKEIPQMSKFILKKHNKPPLGHANHACTRGGKYYQNE